MSTVFDRLKIESAKQVGTLYHLTNLDGIEYILDKNILSSKNFGGNVSFTRNKMMNSYIGARPDTLFKLMIDGNKLSNNYSINPTQFHSQTNVSLKEFEEVVKGPIKDISKYITGIIFIESNFDYYLEKFENSGFDLSTRLYNGDKTFTYKDLTDILKKCEKFGLYIQSGTSIKKDISFFKKYKLLASPMWIGQKLLLEDIQKKVRGNNFSAPWAIKRLQEYQEDQGCAGDHAVGKTGRR